MGQFLRDEQLKNLSLDEACIGRLDAFLQAQAIAKNVGQVNPAKVGFVHYVIRFDQKGYRFTNINDVMTEYAQANEVERIWLHLDSGESMSSNGVIGTYIYIRLDKKDPNACWLTVADDNKAWVDATFSALSRILEGQRSSSRFVRTQWTALTIQLLGVVIGFALSLWAAVEAAPRLQIDHAFTVSFIFALLIFSNTWGYASNQLARLVDSAFPNLQFTRKDRDSLHWLPRAVVGGLATALFIVVLKALIDLATNLLNKFLGG